MVSERVPMTVDGALRGVGDALRRAYQLPAHDREDQAERHELRKLAIAEAVRR